VSEQNIELMKRAYAALQRGDMETVLAMLDPEVEMRDRPEVPDPQTYRGHEGALAAMQASFDTFGTFELVPERFLDGDDHIVVVLRMTATGRTSGAQVEDRIAHLWKIEDGRAVRLRVFSDPDEAIEAAGIA
jgi:uncharacterized protein